MKRHLEWLTQPDQTLKDRSRFWTWYMRGLHGKKIAYSSFWWAVASGFLSSLYVYRSI